MARRVLLVLSGTHGPEGLAGSACQRAIIRENLAADLGDSVRLVLIHILNAYGCAMGVRTTEEGVDLNRNFVEFDSCGPVRGCPNQGFAAVHTLLHYQAISKSANDFVSHGLSAVRERFGAKGVNDLLQGQYRVPGGIGFGGSQPTLARNRLERIVTQELAGCTDVACLDLHTGLGNYGEGMLLCLAEPSCAEARRALRWYGPALIMLNAPGSGLPYRVVGDTGTGVAAILPAGSVTSVTLEFGTYELDELVKCALGEYLLRNFRDRLDTHWCKDMLQQIHAFFYPDDAKWQEAVISRALEVTRRAIAGLREL